MSSGGWLNSWLGSNGSPSRPAPLQRAQSLGLPQPFHDWRDSQDWLTGIIHPSSIDPALEARLLPHMPALFSADLPPCGLAIQIGYQNVVHRLRRIWLATSLPDNPDISIENTLRICELFQHKLSIELTEYTSPLSEAQGHLKPWRRDSVFHYEVKWIAYFVREAQLMAQWQGMSKAEREKQDFANRMYLIPKELGVLVKNKEIRKKVMELWRVWNEGKRRGQMEMGEDD